MSKRLLAFIFITGIFLFNINTSVSFACTTDSQTCSTNYGLNQPSFSSGSSTNLSSVNYGASATAGDLTVGNISSSDFQAYTGYNTTNVPYIQVLTSSPNVCTGSLYAGIYYFRITALDINNVETPANTETSVVVGSTQSCISISWPFEGSASSYRVYFGTLSGSENQYVSSSVNSYTFTTLSGGTANTIPLTSSSVAAVPGTTTLSAMNEIGINGYLSTSSVATATSTFSVRCWVCSGYVVSYYGSTPTNGTYSLKPFSSAYTYYSGSQPSSNEFGINLAVNTHAGIGSAPTSPTLPSYGQVATAYTTSDVFLDNSGDTIAYSDQSSSITNYTISYLYKINTGTPSGNYILTQYIIASGTY
jgi:hypothetical protein